MSSASGHDAALEHKRVGVSGLLVSGVGGVARGLAEI